MDQWEPCPYPSPPPTPMHPKTHEPGAPLCTRTNSAGGTNTHPRGHSPGGRRTRTVGRTPADTLHSASRAHTCAPTSPAHTRRLPPPRSLGARRAGTRTALGPGGGDGPRPGPPPFPRPRAPPAGSRPPATHRRGGLSCRRRTARGGRSRGSDRSWRRRGHTLGRPLFRRRRLCGPRARSRPSPPRGRAAPCARARAPRRLGGRRGGCLATLGPSGLPRTLEGRGLAQPRRPSPFQR